MECHILFDQTLLKIFTKLVWGLPIPSEQGKEAAAITAAYQPQNQHLIVTPKEETGRWKKAQEVFLFNLHFFETLSHEKSRMLVDLWGWYNLHSLL